MKIVLPHAFNLGVPVARIVDLHRGGVDKDWMQKCAAVLTKAAARKAEELLTGAEQLRTQREALMGRFA